MASQFSVTHENLSFYWERLIHTNSVSITSNPCSLNLLDLGSGWPKEDLLEVVSSSEVDFERGIGYAYKDEWYHLLAWAVGTPL